MSKTEDVVRRFYALWNDRNMELADELFEADFRALPIAYDNTWQGQGPESMRHHVLSWLLGMPDLQMLEQRRVTQGEWVVSHWEMRGTHKGTLYGLPATGERLVATGVTFLEIKRSRIAQLRTCFDALGFLQQLGVLPDSASILANIANSSRP